MIGTLTAVPALERPDLLAPPVREALRSEAGPLADVEVAEIDPDMADTAAFCRRYGVAESISANCVVVADRRVEGRMAACVVLATTRADVNGLARRHLGARKLSFAPMDAAVAATSMEAGGITPLGLPPDWPVLVDRAVATLPRIVVGSGLRRSKLSLPGAALVSLPAAVVLDGLGKPA